MVSGFSVHGPCYRTLFDFVAKRAYGLYVSQKPEVHLLVWDEVGIVDSAQVFCVFELTVAGQDLDLAYVGPARDEALLSQPGAALFGW